MSSPRKHLDLLQMASPETLLMQNPPSGEAAMAIFGLLEIKSIDSFVNLINEKSFIVSIISIVVNILFPIFYVTTLDHCR